MPTPTMPDMLGHSIQGLLLPQLPPSQVRREQGLVDGLAEITKRVETYFEKMDARSEFIGKL